jgi:adenylate cyclase
MDRFWQWAWDWCGARYSWVCFAFTFAALLPAYLLGSFVVVAYEQSDWYVEAAAFTVAAVLLLAYVIVLPGLGGLRTVQRWAAGQEVDRARALESTYAYGRGVVARTVGGGTLWAALLLAGVGAIAGASESRLVQYAVLGAVMGATVQLIGAHSVVEGELRPARVAIAGDTGIGDSLPRSRPTFAAWSNVSALAAAFAFAVMGAMLAVVFARGNEAPVLSIVIGCVLAIGLGLPIFVGAVFSPSLQPIRDLAKGTERVAAGDYRHRLPVVQDDDLGALAAAFNRMQAGLAERQRL